MVSFAGPDDPALAARSSGARGPISTRFGGSLPPGLGLRLSRPRSPWPRALSPGAPSNGVRLRLARPSRSLLPLFSLALCAAWPHCWPPSSAQRRTSRATPAPRLKVPLGASRGLGRTPTGLHLLTRRRRFIDDHVLLLKMVIDGSAAAAAAVMPFSSLPGWRLAERSLRAPARPRSLLSLYLLLLLLFGAVVSLFARARLVFVPCIWLLSRPPPPPPPSCILPQFDNT